MRILVTHDEEGNILALAVPAVDVADQLALEPRAGEIVSEIDVPPTDQERPFDDLSRIVLHSRIDRSSGRARLVEKRRS